MAPFFRLNLVKLLVFLFNVAMSWAFFFLIRRFLMRCAGFIVGKSVSIHRNVIFFSFRKFYVGNNVTVNHGCYIDNRCGVSIGNNVNISHDVRIYSLGHNIDSPTFEVKGAPVVISDNVWIFPNVLIMPGVTLGEGAVVLPGSVVVRSVRPYDVVGGNPAVFVKRRACQPSYLIDYPIWFAI